LWKNSSLGNLNFVALKSTTKPYISHFYVNKLLVLERIGITHSSTAKQEEKVKERGSCQTLGAT